MLPFITYMMLIWSEEMWHMCKKPSTHEYVGGFLEFDYRKHWLRRGRNFLFIPHINSATEVHSCLQRFEGEDAAKDAYHWYVTQPTLRDKNKTWYISWEE